MKVAETFDRETMMLPMGTASLCELKGVPWFWDRRKATLCAGGTDR